MDEGILDFVPMNVKGCFLGGKIPQGCSLTVYVAVGQVLRCYHF